MDSTLVCPLDSRRTETEVFIKRFVALFAVLCLHGQLNSLRGMKGVHQFPFSILLFFLNPLYPLCTLIFDIGWAFRKRRTDARGQYVPIGGTGGRAENGYYVAAAIGMHASYEEINDRSSEMMVTSRSVLGYPPWATIVTKIEMEDGMRQIGRLLVLFAIGVQCSATVLLGIRREIRGAASPIDRRYYLYAVSGLALFAQAVVAQMPSRRYSAQAENEMGSTSYVMNITVYRWAVFIEVLHYIGPFIGVLYFSPDVEFHVGLFVIVGFGMWSIFWPWKKSFDEVDKLPGNFPPATIFIVKGLVTILPVGFGFVSVWAFVITNYNAGSDEFGLFPSTDKPCPFLWKDPLADKLWAF